MVMLAGLAKARVFRRDTYGGAGASMFPKREELHGGIITNNGDSALTMGFLQRVSAR